MLKFLILLAVFQAGRPPEPRITLPTVMASPNVRASVGDGFPLIGQLHFEEGVESKIVDVELRDGVGRNAIDWTTSSPTGVFRFNDVRHGRYHIVIESIHYQHVQQLLVVDMQTFAMINVDVSMYPRRSEADQEKLISLQELRRNVPKEAVAEYDKAVKELQSGDSGKATDYLQRAIKIAPTFYEAHLQLGLTHQREARHVQAISSLKEASSLNEASIEARSWLGRLLFEAADFQGAVEALSQRLKLGAPSGDDYFYLGSSYYRIGNLGAAERNLLRTAELGSQNAGQARLQLFNVYIRSGQAGKALEQLDNYLAEFPSSPLYDSIKMRAEQIRRDLGFN